MGFLIVTGTVRVERVERQERVISLRMKRNMSELFGQPCHGESDYFSGVDIG